MTTPPTGSIKTIQRRLVWMLVRVFLIVTTFMVVALIGATLYEISSNTGRNPFYKSPSASMLEAYYMGRGSWEGVTYLGAGQASPEVGYFTTEWNRSILLDQNGDVIMYYGQPYPGVPANTMSMPVQVKAMPLIVDGQTIGTLITDDREMSHPVRIAVNVVNPILWVGLVCGVVTLLFGILLMRRIVNPLAEVVAAAENVSAGNFKTRIKKRKSQDDLSALIDHFNHMTETLERNDTERRALLADIAHELRTPLSVLRGRLEGIVDGVYQPSEVNIAQALEETYLLERLVEDLRLLTLAETRQLHFELKETNLADLVLKTTTLFEPQAVAKSVDLVFRPPEAPIVAHVDPQRMEQVLGNLIGNALRYISGGGTIETGLHSNDQEVEIIVRDSGPGVPADELPFIFDRFWRGEKSRARVSGGAGLGLAICKQLVEAQNGQISAANHPDGGLEICIQFPKGSN